MVLEGRAFLEESRVKELFGLSADSNIKGEVYRKKFAEIEKVKGKGTLYYEQEGVYAMLEEQETKLDFLREIQSCLLLIISESGESKSEISRKLGFKYPQVLENFIENKRYTKTAAKVLVLIGKHYPHILKQYDNGEF